MALIWECDGCDKQTKDCQTVKPVEVEVKSEKGRGEETYHLCDHCERLLREKSNPRRWARSPKAA